jgi:hypothetical protein
MGCSGSHGLNRRGQGQALLTLVRVYNARLSRENQSCQCCVSGITGVRRISFQWIFFFLLPVSTFKVVGLPVAPDPRIPAMRPDATVATSGGRAPPVDFSPDTLSQ